MKIGVLIPTRDRPQFLEFALKQISKQSLQPDFIEIVNDAPLSDKPDVTWRYRIGFERLKHKVDLIIFAEDDDNYSLDYLQKMVDFWVASGKPDLIGITHTIYYNIINQKYVRLEHPGRSSMMSMAISTKTTPPWPDDNYSYTDMHLCKHMKGKFMTLNDPICVGIKHGTGTCGGGGHVLDWRVYNKQDEHFNFLSKTVDNEALNFYISLSMKDKYRIEKYQLKPDPFLSIVTRRMKGKRMNLFKQHGKSISKLNGGDLEQIFIIDPVGYGMLEANTSFQFVKDQIKGKYVHLVDDDDFFTDSTFINVLKEQGNDADIIFFKNKILTGDGDEIYPKPQSWISLNPKRGQIGGSCFVVKKWVYDKYIHHFAKPSFGDWYFITEALKDVSVKCTWIDKLMFETGRVSHGQE